MVGSSLNPHFHFHLVVLDGVFDQAPDGTVRFHEATRLTPDDWLALQRLVQRRVLRHFRTRGLLEEHDADGMPGTRRRRVGQGSGGFSIDASVHIQGDDRIGLERVIRGHRRKALVVPGRRSPSNASMLSPASPPSHPPRPALALGSLALPPTAPYRASRLVGCVGSPFP